MTWCEHFVRMAKYNQRMNQQLLNAASPLPVEILERDLGAFFQSINGTFNHLLVGDLFWLGRFAKYREHFESLQAISRYPQPQRLSERLYEHFDDFRQVREEIDSLTCYWLSNELESNDLRGRLHYRNSKGIQSTRAFAELLSHFFNHQTHHRGQLSTLFSQLGIDIGITDYLIDIPDETRA